MRTLFRTMAVLLLSFESTFILFSCTPKPETLVEAYAEASNNHDVKKIVSLHAEDATFEVVGSFVLKGKDNIRKVAEYDSVLNIHMTIRNIVTRSDTVICDLSEINDWLRTAGIGEAHYSVRFELRNGFIKFLHAEATQKTEQAFNAVLKPLIAWALKERPQQLAEMMPAGEFVYNAENAKKSLSLLREWQEVISLE
ncbi:MAG: nuclear transport factor 2 family protein [bacterium]